MYADHELTTALLEHPSLHWRFNIPPLVYSRQVFTRLSSWSNRDFLGAWSTRDGRQIRSVHVHMAAQGWHACIQILLGHGQRSYRWRKQERDARKQSWDPNALFEAKVPWLGSDNSWHQQNPVQQGKENHFDLYLMHYDALWKCFPSKHYVHSLPLFDVQDVGHAILESYSRVLESLAFNIVAWIDDVLFVHASVKRRLKAKQQEN